MTVKTILAYVGNKKLVHVMILNGERESGLPLTLFLTS